ncbi:MAG: hypothetical protein COA99_19905, partial [Moraxellaceae bacterium]
MQLSAIKLFRMVPSLMQAEKSCAFLLLMLLPVASQAVLTDSLTIGNAKALALAHAVTADPPGIDSIHYNPAGLARIKGRKQQIKILAGSFDIKLELGGYNETRQALLDIAAIEADKLSSDGITKIIPEEEQERWFHNEAYQSTSKTEGAVVVLPGVGMIDVPLLLGVLGGASYSPQGTNITFGTNVYTPLAAGFYRADDDPGRFMGQRLSFTLITYFSPSIAVQLTDTFAFGASLNFNYAGVGMELPFRSDHLGIIALPNLCDFVTNSEGVAGIPICENLWPYEVIGTLEFVVEKALTLGMNVGFLWDVKPWLTLGVVYQSPVSMDMKGDFKWVNSDMWLDFLGSLTTQQFIENGLDLIGIEGQEVVEGKAYLDMTMPDHFAIGMSLQLSTRFKLNMDYKFTRWSEWEAIPITFSQPIDLLAIAKLVQPKLAGPNYVTFPLGMKDTWNLAVGLEYQYNDRLA